MAFKMSGWSPFEKDLFKGKTTKAEKEKQDSLALEEAKKKWTKQSLWEYEKIKKHNERVIAPWEKRKDGKIVPRFRGKSISKTSKTKAK